jgi:hypothetical protein
MPVSKAIRAQQAAANRACMKLARELALRHSAADAEYDFDTQDALAFAIMGVAGEVPEHIRKRDALVESFFSVQALKA